MVADTRDAIKTIDELAKLFVVNMQFVWAAPDKIAVKVTFKNGVTGTKLFDSFDEVLKGIAFMLAHQQQTHDEEKERPS